MKKKKPKRRNPVAKFASLFNKSKIQKSKKRRKQNDGIIHLTKLESHT